MTGVDDAGDARLSARPSADTAPAGATPVAAGVLLGLGMGGFVDGILFHQVLQWHHMVSATHRWPATNFHDLTVNTLADGLFHAATLLLTAAGVALLWRAGPRAGGPWAGVAFVGTLLVGWGLFNLVEGVVNHHLLGIHHVREGEDALAWDLLFLAWGTGMLAGGWWLMRRGAGAERTARS